MSNLVPSDERKNKKAKADSTIYSLLIAPEKQYVIRRESEFKKYMKDALSDSDVKKFYHKVTNLLKKDIKFGAFFPSQNSDKKEETDWIYDAGKSKAGTTISPEMRNNQFEQLKSQLLWF